MKRQRPILAEHTASIYELRKNPMSIVRKAKGFPVAVLYKNTPEFYCVPAEAYAAILDKLEDIELSNIILERKEQNEIKVDFKKL